MSKYSHQQVYVIQHELGPVKIGRAEHPHDRLGDLQVASPFELKVRQSKRTTDAKAVEEYLHGRFSTYRIRGEWFDLPPELRDFEIPSHVDTATGKPNTDIETSGDRNINEEWADVFQRVFCAWRSIKYPSSESRDIEDSVEDVFGPFGYTWHEPEEKPEHSGDVTFEELNEQAETGRQLCTRCGHSFSRGEMSCPTCDGGASNDLGGQGHGYF